jgi:sugar phosphate isomerase/epimerase
VGINLDVAHWWMAGIQRSDVRSNRSLLPKVFHSHISGHSRKGHFGDISLASLSPGDKSEFRRWLELLRDEATQFSGFVAVEYEAAPSPKLVSESLNELSSWLRDLNGQKVLTASGQSL